MTTAPKTVPGFLSLATFGSMLYLASAACALVGVAQLIVPIMDQPAEVLQKFRPIIAINAYEVLLLTAALIIVVWKNVTDDAVSLVVLIAAFIVGSAATLDIIAPDFPEAAAWLGAAGALLAFAKLSTMQRHLVGDWGGARTLGLAVLLAWNFAMPPLFGHFHYEIAHTNGPHDFNEPLLFLWNIGSLLPIVAAAIFFAGMVATPTRFDNGVIGSDETPLLRTTQMRWILATVPLAASFLHEYELSLVFFNGVGVSASSMLMGIVAVSLVVIELRRQFKCSVAQPDHFLAGLPLASVLLLLLTGACKTGAVNAWPSHPPIALALMAIGLAATGLRPGRGALLFWAAPSALLSMLVLLGPWGTEVVAMINWMMMLKIAGGIITLALWLRAVLKPSLAYACAAAVPTTIIFYRLLENHAGWATMLLSVLLLGLGTAASVRKANQRSNAAKPIDGPAPIS